jgi:hypothetical protein
LLDDETEHRIVQVLFELLKDTNDEVHNQMLKYLGLLVSKVKEKPILIICHKLCSNCTNISTNAKKLRYISNIGLKAAIESLTINSLESKAHILKPRSIITNRFR